ncbi:hypothetical protein RRG08_018191 [Elysia crispata]|uniref:Uncharacterized protein n=1 Tax=Elysia crispata TaxID=231223 RepID=A0AAE0ZYP5_9GAST|nr:hypothetical protein RRG08_018191 [Elysia crispata]
METLLSKGRQQGLESPTTVTTNRSLRDVTRFEYPENRVADVTPQYTRTMRSASLLIALCLGLASATMRRQASDAPDTMAPDMGMTSDMMSSPADPQTTMMMTDPTPDPVTTQPPKPTIQPSRPPNNDDDDRSYPDPVTTQPPKPTKLTEIDEILTDFDALSGSDFYKRLSYEDQLLILEVLTGSEVGKMTPILNEIGYKHFIRFLYDMPLRYIDAFKDLIDRGFEKEMKLSGSQ